MDISELDKAVKDFESEVMKLHSVNEMFEKLDLCRKNLEEEILTDFKRFQSETKQSLEENHKNIIASNTEQNKLLETKTDELKAKQEEIIEKLESQNESFSIKYTELCKQLKVMQILNIVAVFGIITTIIIGVVM